MKKRIGIWIILLGSLVACAALVFVGVFKNGANSGKPADLDAALTRVMQEAEPNTHVTLGAFDSMIVGDFQATPEAARAYSSSSVFDVPRNYSVNLVVDGEKYEKAFTAKDEDEERPLQSIPSFLSSVAAANDALGVVTVTDRNGRHPFVSLAAVGDKITLSKPGGYSYGEVYRIELSEDAPYLSFEGKDPSIRVLTVEIEDDPAEAAEYDVKQMRDGIAVIDRSKILNRRMDDNGTLYFDYVGDMPFLGKDDVFYATVEGTPDAQLDFYGVVLRTERLDKTEKPKGIDAKEDVWRVSYWSPTITDVYRYFRMKGVRPLDLEGATVLLNEGLVLEQFRNSSLAFALGKMSAEEFGFTPAEILNFMNEIDLSVDLDFIGNRLHYRITLGLDSFKIGDGAYFGLSFVYENVTDYSVDYDVDVHLEWNTPRQLDYKIKMIEDTQSAFCFKAFFDSSPIGEIPSDADYTARLQEEIAKCRQGESNAFDLLAKDRVTPATDGARVTLPLFKIDSFQLSPLLIGYRADFYFDLGVQAMGLFKTEAHTERIDFTYTGLNGAGHGNAAAVVGTGGWIAAVGGEARVGTGIQDSFGITFLGMNDYLKDEIYGDQYVGATFTGLLGMNWNLNTGIFTGYLGGDLNVTMGLRTGQRFRTLLGDYRSFGSREVALLRMTGDAVLEKWSDAAATAVESNGKRTFGIGSDCLKFGVFDGTTLSVKEQAYKSDAEFSILSGLLCPEAQIGLASGSVFSYTSNDPALISVDEKGTVRVKDGAPDEFTATVTVGISDWAGPVGDRIVTVHFVAGDTREVYVGDALLGDYRPGATLTLPEAEPIRGKRFDRYSYDGRDYHVGDPFTLPAENGGAIVFETHYEDLPSYRVRFYDGYNNLVGIDEVYRYEDATAPYPELRDSHMDPELSFFGWDRAFTDVQSDLTVVGVYVKVD